MSCQQVKNSDLTYVSLWRECHIALLNYNVTHDFFLSHTQTHDL